jgi:DNA-binding response OmpR family regulator/HPt (histidine-containing phosphotransfer) domain-containing protein
MKILLVEDDESTATLVTESLTAHHYLVNTTQNGQTALAMAEAYEYDLVLLDVMLPGLDGVSVCRHLRSEGYQMPILMLTAKGGSSDRIAGLEAGADDYVVKPFNISELMARTRALLRRSRETQAEVLTWENLQLYPLAGEVRYDNALVRLTPKEYGLLSLFLRHPGRIFSRTAILDRVWQLVDFPGEQAVNTHIKGLRQKLKAAGMATDLIETLYGLGYRLKAEPQTPPPSAEAEVLTEIAEIWERAKENLQASFELFEHIAQELPQQALGEDLQRRASVEAHRLIGSLGALGLPEGALVARQIEQLLQSEFTSKRWLALQGAERILELNTRLKYLVEQHGVIEASVYHKIPSFPSGRLLIVDDDELSAEPLKTVAIAWGLQVEVTPNLTTAQDSIARQYPDVVLIALHFDPLSPAPCSFIEFVRHHPTLPVLAMSIAATDPVEKLRQRVAIARLGGQAFLEKPVAPEALLKALERVLDPCPSKATKVLAIDDDPLILTNLTTILEPWGLEIMTLTDPQWSWEMIEAFAPDLLILDIAMPNFNGLELCQAVRNDVRWGELPILFLSTAQDAETVRQVFTVGGDDYVSKPIVDAELIARVLNRLEQFSSRRAGRNRF